MGCVKYVGCKSMHTQLLLSKTLMQTLPSVFAATSIYIVDNNQCGVWLTLVILALGETKAGSPPVLGLLG